MTHRGLLAHVVAKFAPREWENVASASLLYLLKTAGGHRAVNDLLAPLAFSVEGEIWRAQADSVEDSSIPDLVAEVGGRQSLIVEAKFWASLTGNQPLGYLERQRRQFPGTPEECLLVFLAPSRRVHLLTAELESILATHHGVYGSILTLDSSMGRVAVVNWADLLGHLRSAFEIVGDQESLDDLAQLRGLCDRADMEAMLPLALEDVDSMRGRRIADYCDVVDGTVNRLRSQDVVSTKGLTTSGTADGWGRYMRSTTNRELLLWVSFRDWGRSWPTPWWLRVSARDAATVQALGALAIEPRTPFMVERDGHLHIALRPPLGVEADQVMDELARTVASICTLLPDAEVR